MPLPTTAPELLELVRKSGVIEVKRLDAYLEQLTISAERMRNSSHPAVESIK